MSEAVVAAAWLSSQGFPARTMDMLTLGGIEGLTAFMPGISARDVEVWVEDPDHADSATQLLGAHFEEIAARKSELLQLGPVTVVCPECGGENEFSTDQRGTMQLCQHCPATLNVETADTAISDDDAEVAIADARIEQILASVAPRFPDFARLAPYYGIDHLLPPASDAEIAGLEASLGVELPESYQALLKCTRGFSLLDGRVRFDSVYPSYHNFPPFAQLTPEQQQRVFDSLGTWPPPTQGMLCFAEYSLQFPGDQVLFDVRRGLQDGEYPIIYYAQGARPPVARRLAGSFAEFMDCFLEYPGLLDDS